MEEKKLIFLDRSNPHFPPPEESMIAVKKIISADIFSSYSNAAGLDALRQCITEKLRFINHISVDQDRILVTVGSSTGLILSLLLCSKTPGIILCPSPSYPGYLRLLSVLRRKVEFYNVQIFSESGPINQIKNFLQKKRVSTIILNTPHNPTGATVQKSILKRLSALSEKYGFQIISDEAYENYVYEDEHVSPASIGFKNRCYSIFSFSKTYSLSGIRLGYMAVPNQSKSESERLYRAMTIHTPIFSQVAGLAALLRKDFPKKIHLFYKNQMLQGIKILNNYKLKVSPPSGGLSYWINISKSGLSSDSFSTECLKQERLVIQPGIFFGSQYKEFVRVSFSGNQQQTQEGLKRLGSVWQRSINKS